MEEFAIKRVKGNVGNPSNAFKDPNSFDYQDRKERADLSAYRYIRETEREIESL
jgi:hypothetical protein